MADSKLSALTAASLPLADSDQLYVNQAGQSRRVDVSDLPFSPAITARDEGTDIGDQVEILDFVGDGVTATWHAGTKKVTITIPGPTGGTIGLALLADETARDARESLQIEPVAETLTYDVDDRLATRTNAYGTQAFTYNGSGQLTSITGTGKYRSKTFTYTGSNLTSISVS